MRLDDLRKHTRPFNGSADDYARILDAIGDARIVLIGEASHGTHEFYRERSCITKRLIETRGFNAVAVEADWPDAYRVNRWVHDMGDDGDAVDSLTGFQRFPTWMWRNADVLDFIGWLRAHNDACSNARNKVGFYGIDLYSLHASIEAVVSYLDKVDPAAARRARQRYSCFDHYGEDTQAYGYAASFGMSDPCENEVIIQLVEMQRKAAEYSRRDGTDADEAFFAEQNARLVRNAEQYYRSMFSGRVSSWNLRDTHMADTIDALLSHLSRDREAKIVVWAHNSHLGDARATEMGEQGELNVGQLVRQRHGLGAFNIGFTTYEGSVSAAFDWDEPVERKTVRPALEGSYEALFHSLGEEAFFVTTREAPELDTRLLERAIGVIYRPATERTSHYFYANARAQFDLLIHIDRTRAVEPLERSARWPSTEAPETYPTAL